MPVWKVKCFVFLLVFQCILFSINFSLFASILSSLLALISPSFVHFLFSFIRLYSLCFPHPMSRSSFPPLRPCFSSFHSISLSYFSHLHSFCFHGFSFLVSFSFSHLSSSRSFHLPFLFAETVDEKADEVYGARLPCLRERYPIMREIIRQERWGNLIKVAVEGTGRGERKTR